MSQGIGDALMFLPLINSLRSKQFEIDGYFKQKATYELFKSLGILNNLIFHNGRFFNHKLLGYKLYISDFMIDRIFFAHSSISFAKHYALSTNSKHLSLKSFLFPRFRLLKLNNWQHLTGQILGLFEKNASFKIRFPILTNFDHAAFPFENKKYVIIQITSGDSVNCYKNWPLKNWSLLINDLLKRYPEFYWVIIGGKNERHAFPELNIHHPMLVNMIGKTDIKDLPSILKGAIFYLGLDTGLMHLAAFVNTPTVSIWGPSSYQAYGYSSFNQMHLTISLNTECSPCDSPINKNTQRVTHYSKCPDKKCLKNLSHTLVFNELNNFLIKKRLI